MTATISDQDRRLIEDATDVLTQWETRRAKYFPHTAPGTPFNDVVGSLSHHRHFSDVRASSGLKWTFSRRGCGVRELRKMLAGQGFIFLNDANGRCLRIFSPIGTVAAALEFATKLRKELNAAAKFSGCDDSRDALAFLQAAEERGEPLPTEFLAAMKGFLQYMSE